MHYVIILLLIIRPLICEQANASLAILFDIFFLGFFLLHILFAKHLKINKPVFLLSITFPFLIALSNLFSVNLFNSEAELLRVFVLVLIFNFVCFLDKRQRGILIKGMLGISAIVCLRAIYQYFFGIDFIRNSQSFDQLTESGFYAWELLLQKRVVSWFSSPNIMGGYLITFCPLAFASLFKSIKEKNKREVVLFSLLCLVLFLSVILAKALAVFLSFILSMVFLFALLSSNKKTKDMNKYAGIIIVIFVTCLVGLFFLRRASFVDFKNPQNSIAQRVYYWQSSLQIISEHPIAGVGAGNFKIIYPRFKNKSANETVYAHNSYLQIWAESGLVALLIFGFFIFIIFRSAMQKKLSCIDAGIIAGCVAVLLQNFFDYSLFITQSAHIWWIFLACVLSESEHDLEKVKGTHRHLTPLKLFYLILSVLLLFDSFLFYKSENSIKEAVRLFKNKEFDDSIVWARNALRYKPENDLAFYIIARNFRGIEKSKLSINALNYYNKAISLNKNYAFYYWELAVYFFRHNKIDEAKRFIDLAIKSYPQNPKFQSLNSKITDLESY
ncbi:MAG: O-antigen ligase family protein [Candidatus Omnitrophica bacterium]|nr:O-antigen ligase family protein [Candidatus Omnitrophota bacterium]